METNEISRRAKMWMWCAAEIMIHHAMQEVEKMGADERLTKAVTLLADAKNAVADFIDDIEKANFSSIKPIESKEQSDVFTDKEIGILKKRFDDFLLTDDKKCLLKSTNQGFGSILISKKDHKIIYYNHAPTGCDPDDGKVYGYYTHEIQYDTAEDCVSFQNGIELKNTLKSK